MRVSLGVGRRCAAARVCGERRVSTLVRALLAAQPPPAHATVRGWVRTLRPQKRYAFLELNDGSCVENLHAVLTPESAADVTTGACVEVVGTPVLTPGRKQPLELHDVTLRVLGDCPVEEYPVHKQKLTLEYLRDYAHLRPRTNTLAATLRVRSAAALAIHSFFQEHDFVHVHTPILSANDCEGGGDLFTVSAPNDASLPPPQRFFGADPVHLTVSGQLQAEIFATALSRVYTFGPTFRAERSLTHRHLSEFWMVEPELCHAALPDLLALAEGLVRAVAARVAAQCAADVAFLHAAAPPAPVAPDALLRLARDGPYTTMTYDAAVAALQRAGKGIEWGADLSRDDERYLCEELHVGPVFVTHWPAALKPFYMRTDDSGRVAEAFDLLMPHVGELVGGSVREEREGHLRAAMAAKGVAAAPLEWYLDLRRFGSAPHGGFGLGFERLVLLLTGLHNIRDAIPLPRYPGHCPY